MAVPQVETEMLLAITAIRKRRRLRTADVMLLTCGALGLHICEVGALDSEKEQAEEIAYLFQGIKEVLGACPDSYVTTIMERLKEYAKSRQ